MRMFPGIVLLLCLAALVVPKPVKADGELRGFVLGASCLNCHAPRGVADAYLPSLDGLSAASILASLKAYAAGDRPGTIMPRLARGFTETEMVRIATWLAARSTRADR